MEELGVRLVCRPLVLKPGGGNVIGVFIGDDIKGDAIEVIVGEPLEDLPGEENGCGTTAACETFMAVGGLLPMAYVA